MTNEKRKKLLYIFGAIFCAAAFVGVGGFLINFSNGHIVLNVLFSLLAVLMACSATFFGKTVLYKETATWSAQLWAKELILPIVLTIAMILFIKK